MVVINPSDVGGWFALGLEDVALFTRELLVVAENRAPAVDSKLETVFRRCRTNGDLDLAICREMDEAMIDVFGIGIGFGGDVTGGLGSGG